jgi:hypothetical protein
VKVVVLSGVVTFKIGSAARVTADATSRRSKRKRMGGKRTDFRLG